MRWDELFRDLEAQWEQLERGEQAGEVADRTRRELASVSLADRLRAAGGSEIELALLAGERVVGRVLDTGPEWVLLEQGRQEVLVPMAAVVWASGLPVRAPGGVPLGAVAARMGLGIVLRGLVRERAPVSVTTVDGSVSTGTFDRVGADAVDLAVHEPGLARRAGAVRGVRVLPFRALVSVRAH